jgi:hypothetical protein
MRAKANQLRRAEQVQAPPVQGNGRAKNGSLKETTTNEKANALAPPFRYAVVEAVVL